MANAEEKLKKIEEQMKQLKANKQAIMNREKQKERKTRTRRLIQNGALAEKFLQCNDIEPHEFEKLLEKIASHPNFNDILFAAQSGGENY
jgi:hypothetical protein